MLPRWVRNSALPLVVAAGVSACANSNAVQPGIQTSGQAPGQVYGQAPGQYAPPPAQTQQVYSQASASAPASSMPATADIGAIGRVVSVRDIEMRGGAPSGGSGMGRGTFTGGMIGAAGGMAIGSATSRTMGGGLVGMLIGAVMGGVAGAIVDRQGGGVGRGIEVIVEKDDGQTLTIAQRDDGDVQLGDRVVVVADRSGAAKAVRDTQRRSD
jgi:outer membrane lipoprotein SlyB